MKRIAFICVGVMLLVGAGAAMPERTSAYSFGWAACVNPAASSCDQSAQSPQVVFDWSAATGGACQPEDSPDGPVRAFRFRNGNGDWRVQMSQAGGLGNRRLIGPDVLGARREMDPGQPAGERRPCGSGGVGGPPTGDVVMPSHNSSDPASYDNLEWLFSPYLVDDGAGGGTVHGIVHNEFHGDLWRSPVDQCPTGLLNDCWYASLTLASSDGSEQPGLANALGAEYRHPAVADPVASIPYPYAPGPPPFGRQGFAAHSNPVRWGGHYYMLSYMSGSYGAQDGPGNCLLRTDDLSRPDHWRAWGGSPRGFNVTLANPYAGGIDPAEHTCAIVSRGTFTQVAWTLTWNRYLQKFMAIGTLAGTTYFSLSDDLLNWSDQQVLATLDTPAGGCREVLSYPMLLDPSDPAATGAAGPPSEPVVTPNFDHPGRTANLYFTRSNRAAPDCLATVDRDLARMPIRFEQRRATLEQGLLGGDYGYDVRTATGSSTLVEQSGPDYDPDSSDRYAEARTVIGPGSRWASGWLAANHLDDGDDVWYGSAFLLPSDFLAINTTVDLIRWESSAPGHFGGLRLLGSGTATDRFRLLRGSATGTVYLGPPEGFALPLGRWFWIEVHQRLGKAAGAPALNEVFVDGRLVMTSTEQNRDADDSGDIPRFKFGFVHNSSPAGTDSALQLDRSAITAGPLGPVRAPLTPTGLRTVFVSRTAAGISSNFATDPAGRPLQYRLYKKFDGRWGQMRSGRSPNWIDTSLSCGTVVQYRVSAFAPAGAGPEVESLPSAPLNVRTAAC